MHCKKKFTERNSRQYNGQQPATKSARGPGDKPMMNRESTAGFVPPPAYLKFPLFVLARRRSEQLFMVPWRTTETVGFGPTELSAPAIAQLTPPRRPPCTASTGFRFLGFRVRGLGFRV